MKIRRVLTPEGLHGEGQTELGSERSQCQREKERERDLDMMELES